MKLTYNKVEIEVTLFQMQDVVTASGFLGEIDDSWFDNPNKKSTFGE